MADLVSVREKQLEFPIIGTITEQVSLLLGMLQPESHTNFSEIICIAEKDHCFRLGKISHKNLNLNFQIFKPSRRSTGDLAQGA